MIISHKHKFIFFKPIKCAGTSIEVSLIPALGESDIMTGTAYAEELASSSINYSPRNNFKITNIQKISESDINIITAEPIYHAHTPPCLMNEFSDIDFKDYFKFTIVRNPWDTLVSFFWWNFYGFTVIGQEKKNSLYSKRGRMSIVPMRSDSDSVLKAKFQYFLESKMSKSDADGLPFYKNDDTVLSWFEKIFNSFIIDDIDFILKFENINNDYSDLCKRIGISENSLHRFKSNIRKSKKNYRSYYNDYTRDLVKEKFEIVIKKFEYKF